MVCRPAKLPAAEEDGRAPLLPQAEEADVVQGEQEDHVPNLGRTPSWRKEHMNVDTTPMRPPPKSESVDYTPMAGSDFKYYCPLCMLYFKGTILETSCCKNYVCYSCALDFVRGA